MANQELKARLVWIDWLKSIGIFLIIWGHRYCPESIYNWMYSFHVPLFFFISGYLVKNNHEKKFFNYLKKYTLSLMVPYLLLGLIAYSIWFVKAYFHPSVAEQEIPYFLPLLGMLYGSGAIPNALPHSIALWFLPALFSAYIAHYLLKRITSDQMGYLLGALIACLAGYFVLNYSPYPMPYGMDSGLIGFVFFAIGFQLGRTQLLERIAVKRCILFFTIATLLHLLGLFFTGFATTDMRSGLLGNPFAYITNACFGVMSIMFFSMMLPEIKLVSFFSRNTLVAFTLQTPVSLAISVVLILLLGLPDDDFSKTTLMGLVYSVLSIFILSAVSELFRKFLPGFIGERYKNKDYRRL